MISMLLGFITRPLGKILGGIAAAAVVLLGVYSAGRRDANKARRISDLEAYIETDKEIKDVEASPDADSAIERLRDNGLIR